MIRFINKFILNNGTFLQEKGLTSRAWNGMMSTNFIMTFMDRGASFISIQR